jgi:hypothetical protein
LEIGSDYFTLSSAGKPHEILLMDDEKGPYKPGQKRFFYCLTEGMNGSLDEKLYEIQEHIKL